MAHPISTVTLRGMLLATITLVGCGKSSDSAANAGVGHVSGVVTLAEKPLTHGTVLLEKTDHSVALIAEIKFDGSFIAKPYEGTGLPIGKYRLAISSTKPGETNEQLLAANSNDKIPQRYRTLNTSGLGVDVVEGENSPVKIELMP